MKIRKFLLVLAIPLALAGCTSYKSVPYMQNPEVVNSGSNSLPLYDAEIMPKDLLSISGCCSIQFDSTDTVECCLDQYQYYYAAHFAAISCE